MAAPDVAIPHLSRRPVCDRRWARLVVVVICFAPVVQGCRMIHRPVVEAESFVPVRSGSEARPETAAAAPAEAGMPDDTGRSSTGIVVLSPAVTRPDQPAPLNEEFGESADEADVLLIREAWPNPLARGGVSAGEVGIRFDPVRFAYDSTVLDFGARRRLAECARWLAEHPGVSMTLEGHCDERGSAEYNYSLGMSRAWSVRDALIGLGVEAGRLYTISYGEDQPIALGSTPEAYALNRRVELRPFHPSRDGRFLSSIMESAEAPEARMPEDAPPARFALDPGDEDAAWPPMAE
jgi:peptidoglycan-associated lipoprotein